MTCVLCGRDDPLQVLSEEVCRSCMETMERGVCIHIDLFEDGVLETIPGTTFFYPRRVVWKLYDYHFPHVETAVLN